MVLVCSCRSSFHNADMETPYSTDWESTGMDSCYFNFKHWSCFDVSAALALVYYQLEFTWRICTLNARLSNPAQSRQSATLHPPAPVDWLIPRVSERLTNPNSAPRQGAAPPHHPARLRNQPPGSCGPLFTKGSLLTNLSNHQNSPQNQPSRHGPPSCRCVGHGGCLANRSTPDISAHQATCDVWRSAHHPKGATKTW